MQIYIWFDIQRFINIYSILGVKCISWKRLWHLIGESCFWWRYIDPHWMWRETLIWSEGLFKPKQRNVYKVRLLMMYNIYPFMSMRWVYLSIYSFFFFSKGDKLLMINNTNVEDLTPKAFAGLLVEGAPLLVSFAFIHTDYCTLILGYSFFCLILPIWMWHQ